MDDAIDVLTWGAPPAWSAGAAVALPTELARAARAVADHLAGSPSPWLLFWDPLLGEPPLAEAPGP